MNAVISQMENKNVNIDYESIFVSFESKIAILIFGF